MNYEIETIPSFDKDLKKLAKKHKSLKSEIIRLGDTLSKFPKTGISLGNNCYKIRLAIKSKKVGKSGGARIITYFRIVNNTVYLLSIYDKAEQSTISDKKIEKLLDEIV